MGYGIGRPSFAGVAVAGVAELAGVGELAGVAELEALAVLAAQHSIPNPRNRRTVNLA